MNVTQRLVFLAAEEKEPPKWEHNKDHANQHTPKQSNQVGEGGMYI